MLKIDLHTHSNASPDGGIHPEEYAQLLENNVLDAMAITDHNTIKLAKHLHESLGERIIVGEEVTTRDGELIGLFLEEEVRPHQTALETAEAIKKQGGLVYVPHPFETVRQGVTREILDTLTDVVDIMEIQNGRAVFQNRGPQAAAWARLHSRAMAASSDAHGRKGVGTTYTLVAEMPTAHNLLANLAKAQFVLNRPPLLTLLYPKMHRLLKKWRPA